MEDYIYACKTDTDKYAKEVENKYNNHITRQPEPRFSLKHLVKETNGVKKTIMLYILPLNDEGKDCQQMCKTMLYYVMQRKGMLHGENRYTN